MNVLAIGDVVGKSGCDFIRDHLPNIKKMMGVDICIANGENSAVGNGIIPSSAEHLFTSGVDMITTGNHVFRRREIYELLDSDANIIRPANYHRTNPGKGYRIIDKGSVLVAVVNLMGTVYMDPLENPFDCIDRVLKELSDCRIVIVDLHAEATSEKRAMGYYLDGRVSAFFGTHTHVQTADDQVLPNGTGYITDLGMTGPIHSVLGVKPELAISKMKTNMPVRFENPDSAAYLNGCLFNIDEKTGKTVSTERISIR